MPDPNAHDQPAEGGTEQVDRALHKQEERSSNTRKTAQDQTPKDDKKDEK